MYNGKKSKKIFICLAITFMFAFCVWTTGISYAKFITMESDSDSARTARFLVIATADSKEQSLVLKRNDPEQSYCFTISNQDESGMVSEVSITYDVVVSLSGESPFPSEINMMLSCEEIITQQSQNEIEKKSRMTPSAGENVERQNEKKYRYIFENVGNFEAGIGASHLCRLCFTVADNYQKINLFDITVDVIAKQTI